jgi:hypothetical protein
VASSIVHIAKVSSDLAGAASSAAAASAPEVPILAAAISVFTGTNKGDRLQAETAFQGLALMLVGLALTYLCQVSFLCND